MKLFIHLLLIILIGGCTKEIISSSSIPEFIFSAAYFDYNVNSNQMYFYTEIENVNNIESNHAVSITSIIFYNDDKNFITCSDDGKIKFFDRISGDCL